MAMDEKIVKKMTDILKISHRDISAFKALEEQYFLSNNWRKLIELYQFRADAIQKEDIAETAKLFFKSAETYEKHLGEKEKALEAYHHAFALQPKKPEYGDILVHFYKGGEAWGKALEILRKQLEVFSDPTIKTKILLQISYILQEKLQDKAEAKRSLLQILEINKTQEDAIHRLEGLYSEDKQWEELIQLYQMILPHFSDLKVKINLLDRCALLSKDNLEDKAKALFFYQQILVLTPANLTLLRTMKDLYLSLELWKELSDVLLREYKLVESNSEKAKLLKQLAQIAESHLNNTAQAIQYYEQSLQKEEDDDILKTLEGIYLVQKDWKKLSDIYQRQAKRMTDAEAQIKIYTKIGEIAKKYLQNLDMAIQWYSAAYEKNNKDLQLLKILQDLFLQQANNSKLIASYYQEIQLVAEDNEKIAIYNKIAALYHGQKDWKNCALLYEQILQSYPSHLPSLEELKPLYLSLQNYSAFLKTATRQVTLLGKSPESIPVYFQMAEIYKDKLGNEAQAMECFSKILEIDSTKMDVWEALYEYQNRMREYPSVIVSLTNIIHLSPSRAEAGLLEIALIYHQRLDDLPQAIEYFKKVLSLNPNNLTAIRALASIYESTGEWPSYIAMVEKQIALSIESQETIELHLALCQLYRRLDQFEKEEAHLLAILEREMDHQGAFETLKSLYESQEEWVKFIHLLEQEAQIFSLTTEALFALYIKIASLWEAKCRDFAKAIHYYEKARNLYPNDLPTLDALHRLYEEHKEYKKLIGILEAKAQLSQDIDLTKEFFYALGVLWEEKIQNEDAAIHVFSYLLEIAPSHRQALERLSYLYERRTEYEKLSQVLLLQSYIEPDTKAKIALLLQCAALWEEKMSSPQKAIRYYAEVVALDDKNSVALDRLLKLYRQQESWTDLAYVYEKKILITETDEEIISMAYELAALYRDKLNAPNKAIEVYQEILSLDFSEIQAIYDMKELYIKLSQVEALEQTLKMECSLVEDKESKKALLLEMAQLAEEKLKDFPKAIGYYKSVLQHESEHLPALRALRKLYYKLQAYEDVVGTLDRELKILPEAAAQIELLFEKVEVLSNRLFVLDRSVATLEKILTKDNQNLKAYEALIDIHTKRNAYESLIDVLQRLIAVSPAEKQRELWVRCATIWRENLHKAEEAKTALRKALDLEISYLPARSLLEILHTEREEWALLVAFYEEELAFCKDEARRVEVYNHMAKIYEIRLDRKKESVDLYRKTLEIEPTNIFAIQSLENIYREEKRYQELVETYQKELLCPDIENERKIALHLGAAELQRYELNETDEAIQSYLAVLDLNLDPNNLIAIRGLEDLYRQKSQYKDLQGMYLKELELQKDPNRLIDVHLQLACLMEEELDDIDVAIEHFSEAHLSRPQNLAILQRLKTLLRITQRWEHYAETVEKEILLKERSFDLLPLHLDLLQVYTEHLQNDAKSISHGEAILALAPNHLPTIVKLEDLYKRTDQVQKLVDCYAREISLLVQEGKEERLIFLYMERGNILLNHLNDLEGAKKCYQSVLALDPTHKEAISGLWKVLPILKNWEDLIHVYELAAKLTKTSGDVENFYLKIGELWEKEMHNDGKALLAYQIVYSLDSQNYAAINGMRKIFERQKRWGDIIEMLNVEVHLVEDKKKPPLYLRMGEYWEEKLGMPHQALTCYLKVMEHGFHRPTAERIMRIQAQVGDYQGLVEILDKDLRVTEKQEDLITKLLYLGKIQWQNIKNEDAAIETFTKVLRIEVKPKEALQAALDALDQLLTSQKKWKRLITILLLKKDNLSDKEELLQVYTKIAHIYDTQLHSGNLAIKYYENAMELSPQDLELIHTLQRLYLDWGYFKKLIELYKKEIRLRKDDKHRVIELYGKIGEIWEMRLFEDDQAIKAYEVLLEEDKGNIDAVKALARLYKRYQAWEKLIGIYNILIEYTSAHSDLVEQMSYLMELGKVYEDHTKNPQSAIDVFTQVLEIAPNHKEALQNLETLYKSLGKTSDMADLVQQKLLSSQHDEEKLELYGHLGSLYEKDLDNPDKAIEAFEAALQLNENRLDILKSLDWLYCRKKNWARLLEICEREMELTEDLKEKAELCYRLGVLHRDRFQKFSEAKSRFLQSIDYQSSMRKSIKALTGLAILEEDWTQAVKYISMEIAHIKDPSEKVEALNDLGSLYQNKLRLVQKAKEVFQMALEIDPQSTIAIEAMADIYFLQNEPANAEPLFGRLVLLVEKSKLEKLSSIYYKWGLMAQKLSRKDDAIVRYSNALKIQEDNLDALMALGALYFERAQWGFDKTQWQEALDIYQKVYEHPHLEDGKIDIVKRLAIIYEKLEQNEAAIEWYRRLLGLLPEDAESIQALSKLHLRRNENDEALKYLQRIVRSDASSFQDRRSALLTIAEVQTKSGKHKEAIEARLKALGMGVEDPAILKDLGEGYIALQDWDKAYDWIEKHYTCLEEPEKKVENRCLMALIIEEKGQSEEAIRIYEQALSADPSWLPAVRGIAEIYTKAQQWDKVAQAYQSFLKNLPEASKAVGLPIHLALGNLYYERFGKIPEAIAQFEKALALDSGHLASHAALAAIAMAEPSQTDKAIDEHLYLLQREPFRAASYRSLAKLFQAKKEPERSARACRALSLITEMTEEEKLWLSKVASKRPAKVDSESLLAYLVPHRSAAYHEVLSLTEESMAKIYGVDMETKYGFKKKDRLTGDNVHKIWSQIEQIRKILGIASLDVYLSPRKSKLILENTPPSLIVSLPLIESLTDAEIVFLLAKTLFYVAQNQILAYKLEPTELAAYFRLLREGFVGTEDKISAEDLVLFKKIKNALPRKVRKTLEERPDVWEATASADVRIFLKDVDFAANRCALLITDALELSLNMTYRLSVLSQRGQWIKLDRLPLQEMAKQEAVVDLLLYHISEEYGKIRKNVGVV